MKKLMIFAIASIVGIAANAAAVTWSLTSITASPDAAAAAGWVGYVMDATTFTAFSALTADKVADYAKDNALYSGTTANARGIISFSKKDGSYDAGSTVSSYLVLFNNSDASAATYYANTAVASTTISSGGADASITFGTFATATSGWQTTAVPEPTSGLLMVLGMAGLALRRRRA